LIRTNFLLAANDEIFAKIYRKIFLLPEYCDKPDLVISSVRQTPLVAEVGRNLRFDVRIANVGGADSPASKLGIRLDMSAAQETIDLPVIPAGRSVEATKIWRPPVEQQYRRAFMANLEGSIRELTTENNLRLWNYYAYTRSADLRAESFGYSGQLLAGHTVRLSFHVRNWGLSSSTPTTVRATITPLPSGTAKQMSVNIPALATSQWVGRSFTHQFPRSGQYSVRLVIDPTNLVVESDKANNVHSVVVTGALKTDDRRTASII
jgi:subtilase family serine protease